MSRFETELLACRENILALMDLCGRWIDKTNERTELKELVLDLDSSESPTYGHQEGTAFNGYFGCTCYQRCHNRSFLLKFAVDRDENRERLRKTLKGSYVWMLADYLPAGRYAPAWPASW